MCAVNGNTGGLSVGDTDLDVRDVLLAFKGHADEEWLRKCKPRAERHDLVPFAGPSLVVAEEGPIERWIGRWVPVKS